MEAIKTIDKMRELQGMSKRDLSIKADITPEYYSKVLNGHADVSASVLEALAKAVNCKIVVVFEPPKA